MNLKTAVPLLVFAVAGPAFGQAKICVAPFLGQGGDAVRNQIVAAICPKADCVPPEKVEVSGAPNATKAKKLGVKYFVDGKVSNGELELFVLDKYPGNPKWNRSWPLTAGALGVKHLAEATALLSKQLGLEGGAATPPPEKAAPGP